MELTFEFLSFIQKKFIELCQHCSKNCAAGEERRYVKIWSPLSDSSGGTHRLPSHLLPLIS